MDRPRDLWMRTHFREENTRYSINGSALAKLRGVLLAGKRPGPPPWRSSLYEQARHPENAETEMRSSVCHSLYARAADFLQEFSGFKVEE